MKNLIVDSGTTLFTMPKHVYDFVKTRLGPTNCQNVATDVGRYADITFWIKNHNGVKRPLTMTSSDYMLASKGGKCLLAFSPLDIGRMFFAVF